jgi:hypothetical protein
MMLMMALKMEGTNMGFFESLEGDLRKRSARDWLAAF